jgi:hypothetical protein
VALPAPQPSVLLDAQAEDCDHDDHGRGRARGHDKKCDDAHGRKHEDDDDQCEDGHDDRHGGGHGKHNGHDD